MAIERRNSRLLAAAVIIATHPFPPRLAPQNLELTVLDVGQGDSLFLSFPRGRTMLVDGGGELGSFHSGGMRSGIDVGEDVVSPYLWSRGLKQIDVVALTHAHEDHLGGLPRFSKIFAWGNSGSGAIFKARPTGKSLRSRERRRARSGI